MLKLIKLELKRTNLKTYSIAAAACILSFVLVLFLITMATDPDSGLEDGLSTANEFIALISGFMSSSFMILGAVMFGRLVVEEYSGKNAILLFSYPVKRSRVLTAKLVLVTGFITASLLLAALVFFAVFLTANSFLNFLPFPMDAGLFINLLLTMVGTSCVTLGTIMTGLWFGLWKSSLPTTIVTVLIILTVVLNGLINGLIANLSLIWPFAGIGLLLTVGIYPLLLRSTENREV